MKWYEHYELWLTLFSTVGSTLGTIITNKMEKLKKVRKPVTIILIFIMILSIVGFAHFFDKYKTDSGEDTETTSMITEHYNITPDNTEILSSENTTETTSNLSDNNHNSYIYFGNNDNNTFNNSSGNNSNESNTHSKTGQDKTQRTVNNTTNKKNNTTKSSSNGTTTDTTNTTAKSKTESTSTTTTAYSDTDYPNIVFTDENNANLMIKLYSSNGYPVENCKIYMSYPKINKWILLTDSFKESIWLEVEEGQKYRLDIYKGDDIYFSNCIVCCKKGVNLSRYTYDIQY